MNPHAPPATSPASLLASLRKHRQLIFQLTRREVVGRYKGSVMGLAWSFFTPLLMLAIYTFIFSIVFKARWGDGGEQSSTGFAVVMFTGMIVHSLFAEALNRAPDLIQVHGNYVRKIVFPLEILPMVAIGAALFHAAVSLGALICAYVIYKGFVHWTVVFIPFVLLPLALLGLGLAWILASLGVYLRDLKQSVSILTTVLLFLAPIFYPISAVPAAFLPFIKANPVTFIVEQARMVIVWGRMPDWQGLFDYLLLASCVAWAGYAWFQRTKKGFADVL